MNQHITPSSNAFQAISDLPSDTPIISLNLLRFKPTAEYPQSSGFGASSGREAYERYWRLTEPRIYAVGGQVLWRSEILLMLTGPRDETWDISVAVFYPTVSAFSKMREIAQEHADAPAHRQAALADSRTLILRADDFSGLTRSAH